MTERDFKRIPNGTTVRWDEGLVEGKVTTGRVPMFGGGQTDPVKHIAWYYNGKPTGDVTMGHDAAALRRINVA